MKLDFDKLPARFPQLGVNITESAGSRIALSSTTIFFLCTCTLKLQISSILTFCKLRGMMARSSSTAQRNLTLMEELEKLEQSITLTLQGTRRPRVYCTIGN